MPRPKAFDPDHALEQAMRLFWARGFAATAMSDLVEHLGVSRQSLYDTFGDKQAIYAAALRRFREQLGAPVRRFNADDDPVRPALRRLFDAVIAQELDAGCPSGCMLVNAAVSGDDTGPDVQRLLADNARELELGFTGRLRRAQARGELGAHHDPAALGRFFTATLAGLRVTAKLTRDPKVLEDVARIALAVLG